MTVFVVPDGFSNVRLKQHSGTISAFARVQGGDNFILEAGRDEIRNYARHDRDLIIEFSDGQRLTIKDFFAAGADYHNLVLESEAGQELVDFTHAVKPYDYGTGDGIDEFLLAYHAVYAKNQQADIDYDTVVSSVDSSGKQSFFSKKFFSTSFFPILGAVGVGVALAEYVSGNDGDDWQLSASDLWKEIGKDTDLEPPPVVPKDPNLGDEKSGQNQEPEPGKTDSDLHFFKTTGYHLVESRIINKNDDNALYKPIFFKSLQVREDEGEDGRTLPFFEYVQQSDNNPYENVIVHVKGELAEGERVQLRVNGEDEWRDADYNSLFNRWEFSREDSAQLQAAGDLHQVDSRIIDASQHSRLGNSFVLEDPYKIRDGIACIDTEFLDLSMPKIGGSVVGKFAEGDKIQIRFDGGGWYDVSASYIEDAETLWYYEDLPTYASSADDDNILLEEGVRDTIFYRLLDDLDITGGNGSDRIYNFKFGKWGESDVDRIDLTALLIDYDSSRDFSDNNGLSYYLWTGLDESGELELRIDRDGLGGEFDTTRLLTFDGMKSLVSIEQLLNDGQLIVA